MQQQRYNLESGDEVEVPLESDVDATNLPGSFEGDFDLDSDASAAFLDQFNTEKEVSEKEVPAASSKNKQDIPDRIAYLVAAGPPVLNMPSAPVEEETEEEVVSEESGDLVEDLKERTLDESSLVVGDDDLVEEEEVEETPPLVMNVGLTRYIILSTTVMTVAALVPLFLPV